MNKQRLFKEFEKMNLSNPLEYARELVAPLCKKQLDAMILNCNDCKTANGCQKVITEGNPNANYLIISRANDKDYLNELLEIAEIPKDDVFIINSISCILKKQFSNNKSILRMPTSTEHNNCKYFVDYALKFVNPRIVISMGATSLYRKDVSLEDVRGKFIDFNGFKTICTYSPIFPDDISDEEMDEVGNKIVEDLLKAKQYINNLKRKV